MENMKNRSIKKLNEVKEEFSKILSPKEDKYNNICVYV